MSLLNNFKIVFKIGLIVSLLGALTIGLIGFASVQIKGVDDAYSDLVGRADKYTTLNVRASLEAEAFISGAFQLAAETTDEGNARYLAQTVNSRKAFEANMALVLKNMPEQAAAIQPVIASFQKAFTACEPVIQMAAKASSPDENFKAAQRRTHNGDRRARARYFQPRDY